MKKLLVLSFLMAQTAILLAQPPQQTAKKGFEYTIVSSKGTNGSAVIWHPAKKMYITAIAGNADFPLEGFDETGKHKFTRSIGVDTRGMWYNPSTKTVELNAAGEAGWFTLKISADMNSHEVKIINEGQNQPNFQSVGTYDLAKKKVVFLDMESAKLYFYDRKDPSKSSSINFVAQNDNVENYNQTTVGYTGKKGYEFVLLDYTNRKLVFFDRIGKQTATTAIPNDAVLEPMFLFSFANDRAFFYDVNSRTWTAYKVF